MRRTLKILGGQFLLTYAFIFATAPLGARPEFAPAREIVAGDAKGFFEADYSELQTTVVYPGAGFLAGKDPRSPVFVFFAGTGAKSRDYGIAESLSHVMKFALKKGADVLGFQNPLYWQDFLPGAERVATVDFHGTLDAQVRFLARSLELVVREAGVVEFRRPLYVGTRSTSSAVLMQLVRDYLLGKPHAAVVGHLEQVLLMGMLGHAGEELAAWIGREEAYFESYRRETGKDLLDPLVHDREFAIYSAMDWAAPGAAPVRAAGRKAPRLISVVGTNDPLASWSEQVALLRRISYGHPDLKMHAVLMDTFHNPSGSLDYEDKNGGRVKARTMARLKLVVDAMMKNRFDDGRVGLNFHAHESFWSKVAETCELTTQFPPWSHALAP